MTGTQLAGFVVFALFVAVALGLLIRYERTPTQRVTARVVRFWEEPAGQDFTRYLLEVERDGQRLTYRCGGPQEGRLEVGQVVRLHLKGTYAEHVKPLQTPNEEA